MGRRGVLAGTGEPGRLLSLLIPQPVGGWHCFLLPLLPFKACQSAWRTAAAAEM